MINIKRKKNNKYLWNSKTCALLVFGILCSTTCFVINFFSKFYKKIWTWRILRNYTLFACHIFCYLCYYQLIYSRSYIINLHILSLQEHILLFMIPHRVMFLGFPNSIKFIELILQMRSCLTIKSNSFSNFNTTIEIPKTQ